mmetsp:Transcript_8318/g.11630  ORF Transcript_8318/g.11630 Transcript_8318/m.11630 type:complete len:242 (-) Transcript_8318:218-943(-)
MSPILAILFDSLVNTHASTSANCCGFSTKSPLDSSNNMPQKQNKSLAFIADSLSMENRSKAMVANSSNGSENDPLLATTLRCSMKLAKLIGTSVMVRGSLSLFNAAAIKLLFKLLIPKAVLESTTTISMMLGYLSLNSSTVSPPSVASSARVVTTITWASEALSSIITKNSSSRSRLSVFGLWTTRNTASDRKKSERVRSYSSWPAKSKKENSTSSILKELITMPSVVPGPFGPKASFSRR